MKGFLLALISIPLTLTSAFAVNYYVNEGYFVRDPNREKLDEVMAHDKLTVDHVSTQGYEVWGPRGTGRFLRGLNLRTVRIDELDRRSAEDYPSPEAVGEKLKELAAKNPKITELFSIGKSHQGRELWCVRISAAVSKRRNLPKVKYIANMHGDEIVGRELMVRFIEDLVSNYEKEDKVTKLINRTDIYIIPSMNPDGAQARRRGNAIGIDLNRNFPDFTTDDNQNNPNGRALETQAVMAFQKQHKFVLSANFHGGAEVVNYPWDTAPEAHPLEAWFKWLSLEYSKLAPYIYNSNEFPQGIVNGYSWYEVNGGMQDWSYHWHDDKQVTVEVSQMKWPMYSKVPYYYAQNREALIRYLAVALESR